MNVRVMIVDDDENTRSGLAMMLNAEADLCVVAEAEDGQVAVDHVQKARPDVVLMDVRMPKLDGIEATRHIAALDSATRILILTTFDLDEYAFEALRAGASGFLLKDATPSELSSAIRAVSVGDAVVTPRITRKLLSDGSWGALARVKAGADHPFDNLTQREREVADCIAEGLNNKEIAERLFLSEATIKTYVSRLLDKLNARDRVEIVILAQGL